jgi:hypothetical protein
MRALMIAVVLSVGLAHVSPASAQEALLRFLPPNTNALVVIDVKALLASPLATKDGWKEKQLEAATNRPVLLPPEADLLVLAALLNPAEQLEQQWELGVMRLTEPLAMRSIARAEGGYVDTINALEAAWTPSDAYFVAFGTEFLAAMYPANRQAVSRWAAFARDNKQTLVSPYLQEAAKAQSGQTQVVLAFDTKDAIRPHRLREALEDFEPLKKDAGKIQQLTPVIMSLQGVRLEVRVTSSARGTLRADFAQSPAPLESLAKPLMLATLDRFGAHLDDLDQWTAKRVDQALVMEGPLGTSSLRRIFSLLELPSTKFSQLKDEEPSPGSPEAVAKASQEYFKSVTVLIDDLQKTLKDTRDNHAVWMERFGRNIDRLPILNVDEELLAWGAQVAETFREMSVAERSANVRAGVRKSQVYGAYSYQYDNNGYYSARSTESVRNQIRREESGAARQMRFNSWKEVEDATAAIRAKMTRKYQLEF